MPHGTRVKPHLQPTTAENPMTPEALQLTLFLIFFLESFYFFKLWTCSVVQTGLEFVVILLLLPRSFCDYRHLPGFTVLKAFMIDFPGIVWNIALITMLPPSLLSFFFLFFFLFLILILEPRALDIVDKSSARLTCVVLVNYKQYWCHVPRLIQVSTVTACLLGFSTLCETSLFVVVVCSPGNRSPDHIHSRPTPCHWAVIPAPTKSLLLKRFRFDTASRKWLII